MRLSRWFAAILWLGVLAGPGSLPAMADPFYVVVGAGGHRMLSQDGKSWENHAELGPAGHDQNDLNVVTSFKGMIVVGGGYFSGRIMATRDGKNWSDGVLPDGKLSKRRSSPVFGVEVLDETLYLVTLRGQVYATTDGENYEEVAFARMPTETHWIRQCVQGNGIIVGSGDYGPAIAFDPKTREIQVTQMDGQIEKLPGFKRVAFGHGLFVVGGQDGLLASSRDGKNWENNQVVPERGHVESVVWCGDHFLACTAAQQTLVSQDGINWIRREGRIPKRIVRANDWLYGWNRRTELSRSRDGVNWEPIPNERTFTALSVGYGELAGQGDPPILPVPRSKR